MTVAKFGLDLLAGRVETSDISTDARVILYYEDSQLAGGGGSLNPHVIDLANRETLKVLQLDVIYASNDEVFARADIEDPEFDVNNVKASLVYPLFSESWRVPVKVSPVTDLGPHVYSLRPLEEWEYLNRRTFLRVGVSFPITFYPAPKSMRLGIACVAENLSNSGVAVRLPEGFSHPIDDMARAILHMPDGDLEVEVSVAARRGDVLGVAFTKLSDSAEKRVGRIVFQAQVAKKRLLSAESVE